MPLYTFKNLETDEVYDKILTYDELQEYVKQENIEQIFKSCPNLIKELQAIPVDPNKPEDVDTKAQDHAYDALRYLIMSRPRTISSYEHMQQIKKWTPSDPTFGY